MPYEIAQASGLDQARIQRQVGFARRKHHDRCHAVGRIRIRVQRIVTTEVGVGEQEARRQHAERDLVFDTRNQVLEQVQATVGGVHHVHGVIATGTDHAVGATAGQRHLHTVHARLAGILDAVAVEVIEHPVTESCLEEHTGIDTQVIGLAGHQRDGVRHAVVVRIGIRVHRVVCARVQRREHRRSVRTIRRQHEHHDVVTRRQILEQVQAAVGCQLRRDRVAIEVLRRIAVAVQQLHLDAVDARLATVLDAVGIQILEHPIAQVHLADQTRIQRVVDVAR